MENNLLTRPHCELRFKTWKGLILYSHSPFFLPSIPPPSFVHSFVPLFLPSFLLSFVFPSTSSLFKRHKSQGWTQDSVSESWVAAPQYISLVFHTAFQGRISGGILRTTLTKHLLWKEQFLTEDKYIKGELQEVFEPFSGENKVLKQKVESCCVQICRH